VVAMLRDPVMVVQPDNFVSESFWLEIVKFPGQLSADTDTAVTIQFSSNSNWEMR